MADQYTTETRKDGNGNNYDVRVPLDSNLISAQSLAPTPTLKFPDSIPDSTDYGSITGGITNSIVNDYKTLNQQLTDRQKTQDNTGTDITKLMEQLTGKASDTQVANEAAGVNTETANLNKYVQQLADLNSQASSLNREALAVPIQTQERNANTGATDAGVAPQNAGALRLNALKALSIGQQADIASAAATGSQLRLQAAKDKAQQIIDLKYKPLEETLAIKEKQYELNKDVLMSIDKNRAEALGLAIDKEKTALADKKALVKTNVDKASEYAKYAIDGGQAQLASQISSLDPESKTFSNDLAKLQSQIKNPSLTLDLAIKSAQLAKLNRETSLLGKPTAAQIKADAAAIASAKASLPAMQDKIDAVDILKNSQGLASRVGPNFLSRGFLASDTQANLIGAGQSFAGGIQKLLGGLTLQNLIDAKAQGATFGALSEGELNLLANSANAINSWEIKDKSGNGTGYWNIDEASFNRELDSIKTLTQRAIALKTGETFTNDETKALNDVFSESTEPSSYFNK